MIETVLVIGSGGREHALAREIAFSPTVQRLYIAPGNAGTSWKMGGGMGEAVSVPIPANDVDALLQFARDNAIDLTVVGPEAALAAGIVDRFQAAGLNAFGPTRAAAQLETSKAFAKAFMKRHNIPTAEYGAFKDFESARKFAYDFGRPVAVKADGLASGKGVILCDTPQDAEAALRQIILDRAFGLAGSQVVIEELLKGPEASALAFCDGTHIRLMPIARDHKRAYEGDLGPNTGGMGAYCPVPDINAPMRSEIRLILQRTIDGMRAEGIPYRGILYAGLMLTPDGIRVLEFNCRFGDPETQALMMLFEGNLAEVMDACARGALEQAQFGWKDQYAVTVVVASEGYPGEYKTGVPIKGLYARESTVVFQAGTAHSGDEIITAGGRVLAVTAAAGKLEDALQRIYSTIEHDIFFEGMHYRRDIGVKAALQTRSTAPLPDLSLLDDIGVSETPPYAGAGVNIAAGAKAVELMRDAVQATYTPQVLAGIGSFGGLYDASAFKDMASPVLVASTDGVGTKTKVAGRMNRWDSIGADLVNHCVNDILAQGARPLFFLDYVASSKLLPEQIASIVTGAARACLATGCALIGGETAEMPGVYEKGEIDLAGTIIGVIPDRAALIDGSTIQAGDAVLALPSTGLHTNGYSLARRVLGHLDWHRREPSLGMGIGEALLAIHRCYLSDINRLRDSGIAIKGLAHITGGGVIDNLPRILPKGLGAAMTRGTWAEPPIFKLIHTIGQIDDTEMFHVFNMGLGMLIVVAPDQVSAAKAAHAELRAVGVIVSGEGVKVA